MSVMQGGVAPYTSGRSLTPLSYLTARDGALKHDYPANEWRLVPLAH